MKNVKYLGIDLHTNQFTCCMLSEGEKKQRFTFPLDPVGLENFYKILDRDTYVMVEASTNTFNFVDLINDKVKELFVANTHKLKLISMVKKKTDRIDAEKLAIYLKMQISSGEELIKPVHVPPQTIRSLRSLFTTHKVLTRQKAAIKNRIHSILKQHLKPFTKESIFGLRKRAIIRELDLEETARFQINILMDQLEYFDSQLAKIADKIKIIGSIYIEEIEILTSMKGISVFIALALIADISEIQRFPNAKHFLFLLTERSERR